MAASYNLRVITPERKFFDGETTQIVTRTTTGDVGILANHYSYVACLKQGQLKIMQEDGGWRIADVTSGIMRVGGNKVTILADSAKWAKVSD